MHARACLAAVGVGAVLVGCTATPPKTQQVSNDPLLSKGGGALLVVDVCVQRDELGDGDYFVIDESASGSRAALALMQQYLAPSDLHIRSTIAAVCAARLNADRSLIRAADNVDADKRQAAQPLQISGAHTEDPQYVQALAVISTYAFERAAVEKESKPDDQETRQSEQAAAVQAHEFRAAASVIQIKTGASSVVFLGALGTSRSTGKAVAQRLGSMAVGLVTGVATAGLGTGYYVIFRPGYQIDGVVMEGALIDLHSGELTWSNAVRAGGDPVHPETIANRPMFEMLFREVMFRPVAEQSAMPAGN